MTRDATSMCGELNYKLCFRIPINEYELSHSVPVLSRFRSIHDLYMARVVPGSSTRPTQTGTLALDVEFAR